MLPPFSLYEDHRRQKFQLKLIEIGILFTYLSLNLLSFDIQSLIFELLVNELLLMCLFGLNIGFIIPNFLHIDRSGVLIAEIAVFKVVDDFDLGGVVRTVRKAIDES